MSRFLALAALTLVSWASPALGCDADDVDSIRSVAMDRYNDGDYPGFVARMEAVAAATQNDVDVYNLACGYALTGQGDQAVAVLQGLVARGATFDLRDSDLDSLRTRKDFVDVVALELYLEKVDEKLEPVRDRAMVQYEAGRYDVFVAIMERVAAYSRNDRDIYNLACGYALNGQRDEALAQLQILAGRGADYGVQDDSDFDAIRRDPRFGQLAAKMSAGR